jgi:hypothetical protein
MHMENRTSTQAGFGIVLAILTVLILAGVVGAGWLAYKHDHKSSASKGSSTTSTKSSSSTKSGGSTPSQNDQTAAKTYKIPELGIELTLPSGLSASDLVYAVDTTTVPGTDLVDFTTSSLQQAAGADSQCGAIDHPLGSMRKTTQNPATSGASYAASKSLDGFYVLYDTPQQGCSSNSSAVTLETTQAGLLQQALSTAVSLN